MDKPIQILTEEHSAISQMLKVMERIHQRLKGGKKVDKNHLEMVMDFLRNFADKCHHGKEETILFPELLKDESLVLLVNELLGEHRAARNLIGGMSESLEQYEPGNKYAMHIAANISLYIRLLVEHIKKEGSDLFPAADKILSKKLVDNMKERFDGFEREDMGENTHDEYLGWLNELEREYLS